MSHSPPARTDEWLTWHDLPVLFALLLMGFVLLAPSLWPTQPGVVGHQFSDVAREFFGSRAFAFETLARKTFPFWDPYIFGGTPYFASPGSALLYPLNILFLMLPTWAAINVTMGLHLGLALSGTYLFSRAVGIGRLPSALAGVAFGWSSHLVLNVYAGHLTKLCTFPWLPISLAALERTVTGRRRGLAALALAWAVALMFLAGHIQIAIFGVVGMIIYGGVRLAQIAKNREAVLSAVGNIAVAGVLVAALVAVQIVPTLEFFSHSVRQAIDFGAWVKLFHFPPENLINFIIPDFFGNFLSSNYWGRSFYWETCFYIGLLPLGFAVLALVRRPHPSVTALAVTGAAALILALDGVIPGLGELLAALPGFRSFRGYAKFGILLALALAVLAGWGLEVWMREHSKREPSDRPLVQRFGLGLFVIAGVATLGLVLWTAVPAQTWEALVRWTNVPGQTILVLPPSLDETFLEQTYNVTRMGIVRSLAVLASCGIVLFFSGFRAVKTRTIGWLVVLVTVADLAAFGLPYGRVVTPVERITLEPKVVAYLDERIGPNRIMLLADELLNRPHAHRLAYFGGNDAIVLGRLVTYFNRAHELPIDYVSLSLVPRSLNRLADLYAVSYLLRPRGKRLVHPHLQRVFAGHRHAVYRNLKALPRALISRRLEVVDGQKALLERLAEPNYNPRSTLYVLPGASDPAEIPIVPKKSTASGTATIVAESPNQVVVDTNLEADGYLYLADPAYPGWRVEVDGRPERWFEANVCCRAVALTAGRHRVIFTFRPRFFAPLAVLAAVAWLGSLGAVVAILRRPTA